MPLSDASLDESRQLFELNVWSVLAVTQAFLTILLKMNHA
jgi:1-acylglycerone phosphate reductase